MKKEFSPEQREELLKALKARFEECMNRHKGFEWWSQESESGTQKGGIAMQ